MEYSSITFVLSVTLISVCRAEYTADMVYEFLTNRLDNVFFDIRNMRRDIGKLSDQIELLGLTNEPAQSNQKIEEMLETFRDEINDIQASTEGLESSVLKKLESIVEEKVASCHDEKPVQTLQRSTRVEIKKYLKSLSAEKQFIREVTNNFENRINDVEQEMDSFTKASWKGEKGSPGLPGISGLKGSKGDRGLSTKGQKGDKGDNGLPGQSGLPGMSGDKGQNGEIGNAGAKGQKGTKGSRQTENHVYFTVTLTTELKDMGPKEIVVFDRIESNAGGAYSSTTGKFTAPVSGTYLFLFNVQVGHEKLAHVFLVLDGEWKSSAVAEGWHAGHDAGSGNSAVFHVSKGESVWIETARFKGVMHDIYSWRTSFSGVLLHAS